MPLANTLDKVQGWRMANGAAPTVVECTVATSQAIKRGDIVKMASGVVSQSLALASASSVTTSSAQHIYGIADADITTDSSGIETAGGLNRTTIPVLVFDGNLQIPLRFYAASATDAELQDITLGAAHQFGRYTTASTSFWFYVIVAGTTTPEFVVHESTEDMVATSQYPVLWVSPTPTYSQWVTGV